MRTLSTRLLGFVHSLAVITLACVGPSGCSCSQEPQQLPPQSNVESPRSESTGSTSSAEAPRANEDPTTRVQDKPGGEEQGTKERDDVVDTVFSESTSDSAEKSNGRSAGDRPLGSEPALQEAQASLAEAKAYLGKGDNERAFESALDGWQTSTSYRNDPEFQSTMKELEQLLRATGEARNQQFKQPLTKPIQVE